MTTASPAAEVACVDRFHAGHWTEAPDPFNGHVDDLEAALKAEGYARELELGNAETCIYIEAWRRRSGQAPEWYLMIGDRGNEQIVLADGLPDVMDLLARWAPIVQAAAVSSLLDQLGTARPDELGLVELIAQKAVLGARHVDR